MPLHSSAALAKTAAPAYTYVFVRTDIELAQQLVQVGHACLEAGNRFQQPNAASYLVLFGVASEAHLRDATALLQAAMIRFVTFFEPDKALGYTAVCTEPLTGRARAILKRFKLWRPAMAQSAEATQLFVESGRAPPDK